MNPNYRRSFHRPTSLSGREESDDGYSERGFYDYALYNQRLPRRPQKKLLVLDVNGLLAHTVFHETASRNLPINRPPDGVIGRKLVYKRPFCDDFLRFCFETFNVGIWSSAQKSNLEGAIQIIMGDLSHRLVLCWDQADCTDTGRRTLDRSSKPLFLKELHKLWNDDRLPWPRGYYSCENTLLIDDSPYKALNNPPFTAIFPYPYDVNDVNDSSLGRRGDLRNYLEGVAYARNVQVYVQSRPFGQPPISQNDPDWLFDSQVVQQSSHHPDWRFYSQVVQSSRHRPMHHHSNYRI